MRLSEWAEKQGISYRTARRWFDDGKINGAYRISERIIIVPEDDKEISGETTKTATIYARVSSNDQKQDLERQANRLEEFAINNGYVIQNTVKEIASGMNQHRKKLQKILQDPNVTTIIVEYKDRLARMNADLIISASNKEIIVVNENEPEYNDTQDVIDFLTSWCARIYGKRAAKNNALKKAQEILRDN